MQVVGRLVHGVVVRAPVMQLDCVQHFRHGGHYAVRTVAAAADLMARVTLKASLIASLSVASLSVASL